MTGASIWPEVLEGLGGNEVSSVEEAQAYLDAVKARARLIKMNPIFGFVPNEKQMDFIAHDAVKRKAMIGSNKLGKSTLVVIEAICHALGYRPFLPKTHENYRVLMPSGDPIRVPNIGQVTAEDFPNGIGDVLWPMFRKWLPRGSFKISKTERSIVRELLIDVSDVPWADPTSDLWPHSVLTMRAYEQGQKKFAGKDPDWILDDEPPPKKLWIEQMRGLISTGGKWMGAMTPVDASQVWIYDLFFPAKDKSKEDSELVKEFGGRLRSQSYYVVTGSMYDNVKSDDGSGGLTEVEIREFAESIDDPVERQVRVDGKPLHLMGTEYGRVWDPDVHIVAPRERDPDNCYVVACDAHPTKPFALLFAEINPKDEWHIWAESYDDDLQTLEEIAHFIKDVERWQCVGGNYFPGSSHMEARVRLIDPIAKTIEKTTGLDTIQSFAVYHDLYWTPWKRGNKANRVRTVKEWLKPGSGPLGHPRVTISEDCPKLAFQIPRYREKMPKDPEIQARSGDIVDVEVDLVESLIAMANSGLTFRVLDQIRPLHRHTEVPPRFSRTVGKTGPSAGHWGRKDEPEEEYRVLRSRAGGFTVIGGGV